MLIGPASLSALGHQTPIPHSVLSPLLCGFILCAHRDPASLIVIQLIVLYLEGGSTVANKKALEVFIQRSSLRPPRNTHVQLSFSTSPSPSANQHIKRQSIHLSLLLRNERELEGQRDGERKREREKRNTAVNTERKIQLAWQALWIQQDIYSFISRQKRLHMPSPASTPPSVTTLSLGKGTRVNIMRLHQGYQV